MTKVLKLAMVAFYGIITLEGEYGIPMWLHILFSLRDADFWHRIHSWLVLITLLLFFYKLVKPPKQEDFRKYFLAGLILLPYISSYCNQPSEHQDPFDFTQGFIWEVLLFISLWMATVVRVFSLRPVKQN